MLHVNSLFKKMFSNHPHNWQGLGDNMIINNTDHRPEECGNDFRVHYSGQISDSTFSLT